jgi:hypothetical protein
MVLRRRRRSSSGSAIVESAVLIFGVAMALAVFFSFIRAAVASRIKMGADTLGHNMVHDGS